MKYTPLNLNFIQNQYNPQADQIRNTAAAIMANAGWSKERERDALTAFNEAKKKAQKEYNSAHRQTFLSSIFDLLQTPLYGVANALDEALAGHQSDSNDSVGEDLLKTLGGVGTGLTRGLGAGLRGASGILDVLPGVDINDDWQSNPEDKTHFSDVAIRNTTHMATRDALNPKNWEQVKPRLEAAQNKGLFDKTFFELFIPDNLDSPDAQQKYVRNQMLAGIPVDIGADPLNAVTFGLGGASNAAKATKGLTEGLDVARANEGINSAILRGLNSRAGRTPEFKAPPGTPAPITGIAEGGTLPAKIAEPITAAANSGVALPAISHLGEKGAFKTLAKIGGREGDIPAEGLAISIANQKGMVAQVAKMTQGGGGWIYRAANYLNMVAPEVEWNKTFEFLEAADRAVKAAGGRHDPAKLAKALAPRVMADVRAMRAPEIAATPKARAVNEITDVGIRQGQKLKMSEARLVNDVVRKFENEILHTGRAPGTGEGLARAIAAGDNVRYSGPQQARMWNQITSQLKYANPAKFEKATRILRSVEDYFITKGMIPHSAAKASESVPLRLSQVAEAIGPEFLGKSHAFITGILRGDPKALAQLTAKQIDALRNLRASEAISAAPAVNRGIDAGKEIADQIAKANLSAGRKKELIQQASKTSGEVAAAAGAGEAGAHVAQQFTGNILGRNDIVEGVFRANRLKTNAWIGKVGATGKGVVNDPNFIKSVNNAITKASGLPSPAQVGKLVGSAAKVQEWFGARFNAAYGVQDMNPIFLKQQSSAMATTARRAKILNKLAQKFPPRNADLWHEAFRTAQQNGIADGQVASLQAEIAKVMENLVGGTGLRSGAIADSTVVGRNRILMDELNKNLKRFGLSQYKFENSKRVTDAIGDVHDLSKGVDWMRSWEMWDVKNPYEFLHRFQNVIEYTVREKAMFDEIVSRFASPAKHGDVRFGVEHPRLNGFYFTKEGAKQAQTFVKALEQFSTPSAKSLQYFDHVLSKLKAGLTIYGGFVGHQMTNLIGSTYFNWIAGVNKPIRYEQAIKVMMAQNGRYGEISQLGKLTGPKALEQAVARSMVGSDAGLNLPAAGNRVIVKMQNGTKVTADMIYTAAFREGVLPSAKILEDVESGVTSVLDKIKPLGGHGQRAVHQISEVREHIPRLALFIDRVAKSKGNFASAIEDASAAVRKWHPDGTGFTNFERRAMKRIFPFYSWTRKAIPLAVESVIFAGPKVMAYPRLMEAIALGNGIDPAQQVTDPFPTDQMFPDWLRNRGIGPTLGGAGSYGLVNPSTPILDVLAQTGNPGQTAIDMLNPMVKVPIEVGQSRTLGDASMPIQTDQQWADYLTKQIPVASTAGRLSGQIGVSDKTREQGFPDWTAIMNLLTGAKRVDTGKYQKSAQFDLRDYLKQKAQQQGR